MVFLKGEFLIPIIWTRPVGGVELQDGLSDDGHNWTALPLRHDCRQATEISSLLTAALITGSLGILADAWLFGRIELSTLFIDNIDL